MVFLIRLIALATLLSGCFSPALDGKFHCGDDSACPPGLHCASDSVCRDETVDAASSTDASKPVDMAMTMSCVKKACTPMQCGVALDGCGGQVMCPMKCSGQAKVCGGGGMANVCGNGFCIPTSCQAKGATCGLISDNCANVLDCGSCSNGQTCGADNKCG